MDDERPGGDERGKSPGFAFPLDIVGGSHYLLA